MNDSDIIVTLTLSVDDLLTIRSALHAAWDWKVGIWSDDRIAKVVALLDRLDEL